jgi:hypothetical protein
MVVTDDVMYEVERVPDDKAKAKPIYKDIKHYETNFLGAVLLEETERPKPIVSFLSSIPLAARYN